LNLNVAPPLRRLIFALVIFASGAPVSERPRIGSLMERFDSGV
jgi:hypothetical protein